MKLVKLKDLFNNYKYYILIILFSLFPLVSIFITSDLLHTHDGLVHLPRIAAFYKALTDGQFPVRWAGDLNYGYGMPLFNFIYPLPYIVSSVFLFLGISLVNTFKISLSLSFVFSGIFMYAFAKSFFNDDKKALLVSVFYQFATFRLIEVLIRGSFGEVYTYAFFPLVLFGLINILKNKLPQSKLARYSSESSPAYLSPLKAGFFTQNKEKVKKRVNEKKYLYFLISSFSTAFLILSHNALSLSFFSVCVLFLVFFSEGKKDFIFGLMSLLAGVALSSYYWIPAILEHKYTYGDLFMKNIYLDHFPPFYNFFIPNFNNNSSLQTGGISVQLGIFHAVAVILAIVLLVKGRFDSLTKKLIIFCLLSFFIILFFMQPVSKIFWENISFLRQFQFPWRLLGIVVFVTSMLSVSFMYLPFFKKKMGYLLIIILVILSSVLYWKPALGYDKINENYYWNFPLNTTYYGETDVIWSAGPAKSFPKSRVDVINGEANIKNFSRKSYLQQFNVSAKTDTTLVLHTQYFPGWRVYIDGIQSPIQFQDGNWRGLITFHVPKGQHLVKAVFGESKIRFLADTISLVSLISLFMFWFINRKKNVL